MESSIARALSYLDTCQNENGGFGYTDKNPNQSAAGTYWTLTGVGMLCHQMWGKGKSSSVRKAARYVAENSKFDYNTSFADLYGHYYESQAMIQFGGDAWKKYNNMFRDQLLNNQETDGSWKAPGGGKPLRAAGAEYATNAIYRNALCVLMLEVYYRFLSTGGTTGSRSGLSGI
jgi:hypothetical protein